MKTYKVFAPPSAHAAIEALGTPVARYEAFVVVQLDARAARSLAPRFPMEDLSDQFRLPLHGGELDPLKAPKPRGSAGRQPSDGLPHHYLVQFVGPVKTSWMRSLRRAGATIRHPTAGFGVVVRADGAAIERIAALSHVRWTGHLPHADRIAASLTAAGPAVELPRRRALPGLLTLEAFDGADLPRLAKAAQALGFEVVSRNKRARRLDLHFSGTAAQQRRSVAALAAVHGVRLILPRVMPRTCNPVAAVLINQRYATGPDPGLGLSGDGEIVAVCDTGLDSGDAAAIHPDFDGRVLAIRSYPISASWRSEVRNAGADDGAADTDSGHGTHVAGSVLGNGNASAGLPTRIQGMAPKARLVFQAIEQEVQWRSHVPKKIAAVRFQLAGIPDDLEPLFGYAWRKGARIHSNSWGGGEPGEYDAQCGQLDRFMWDHKGFLVLVAAGNDGSDTGGQAGRRGNGRIDPMSVTSPATAKNCITVGASENLRREFDGELYGDWWPDDFPRVPFRTDPMADDPTQVAAFSSRGPTVDGRIKPELVAPGTFILSTRSSRIGSNNFAWGAFGPAKRDYFHMGGTSMATPIVAGCAALVREWLRKRRRITQPSAALVKALLIAGAKPLQPLAGAMADNAQGYGRVDLRRSLERVLLLHDSGAGLRTGAHSGLRLTVPRGGGTLRVALAYTDFPGPQLVNNLNLFVIDPQGRPRAGNAGGSGAAALVLDSRNNTEVVEVRASAGNWQLEVVGSNVPQGPQDFALAAVLV